MKLDKAAKEALSLLAQTLPGGSVLMAALDDRIDAALATFLPQRELDELREAAEGIAEDIRRAASPHFDRNPGAAVAAAHDFLDSLKAANVTFELLLEKQFDRESLLAHLRNFRPSDWNYASPQRKQLWDLAVGFYLQRLLDYHAASPKSQGYILMELLKRTRQPD